MQTLGERLRWALHRVDRKQSDLARACGVSRNAVGQWMSGSTAPTEDNLAKTVSFLKIDIEWLTTGEGEPGAAIANVPIVESSMDRDRDRVNPSTILEVDVRAGAGPGGLTVEQYTRGDGFDTYSGHDIRGEWSLPDNVMREYLRTTAHNVRVFEVLGDSMEPRLYEGDRVFIDIRFSHPSPEGIFALYDGHGLVIKRLQIVRGSDPLRIRIISINSGYEPYDALAEEIKIIGRLAGRFTTN